MKAFSALIFSVLASAISQANAVNLNNIDLEKARAYQAYVMTFAWPDNMSSETVEYKDVFSQEGLIQNPPQNSSSVAPSSLPSPFESFQNAIGARTQLLTNNSWTLIFPEKGASISEQFFSNEQQNGYPALTGKVTFTLGRYLESDLHYQHYRFGNPTSFVSSEPVVVQNNNSTIPYTNGTQIQPTPSFWNGPSQVLPLHFVNKTASKKLNYIDHPIIGTLIYFEPIELEQAIDLISQR